MPNSSSASGDVLFEIGEAGDNIAGDSVGVTATQIQTVAETTTTSCSMLNYVTAKSPPVPSSSTLLTSASKSPEDSLDMLSAQIWETQIGNAPSSTRKPKTGVSAASGLSFLTRSSAAFHLGLHTGAVGATGATGFLRATGATGTIAKTATSGSLGATSHGSDKNSTWTFSKSGMPIAPTVAHIPGATQGSVQTHIASHSPTLAVTTKFPPELSGPTESDSHPTPLATTAYPYITSSASLLSTSQPSVLAAESKSATLPSSSSKIPVAFKGVGVKLSSFSGQSLSLVVCCLFFFAITH